MLLLNESFHESLLNGLKICRQCHVHQRSFRPRVFKRPILFAFFVHNHHPSRERFRRHSYSRPRPLEHLRVYHRHHAHAVVLQHASEIQRFDVIIHIKLTGVEHLKNNNLSNLSGGEFQRVLIARAIAKNPDLLVLDEPVQGVDFKGEISLYELIKEISEKVNCGILLISHDLHVVMSSTDYVVCLNGHVCCSGTPQSVANNNKYQELFGDRASTILSVYEHKHDHTHSTDGTIKRKQ